MKKILFKSLRFILQFVFFAPFALTAQDLTGIWKGYFISDEGENYKLEFQISQRNPYGVTGVSYSYLDIRFYGKATMTGSFIKSSSSFKIREIKTVEVKSSLGGATCIMNYKFKYSRSGREEFLEGTYLGKFEKQYTDTSRGFWGDCGGGKVFLRKVATSDFYVEPFLRNKINTGPVIVNQPPVRKNNPKVQTPVPPVKKPVVISRPPVTKNPPVNTKPVTKPDLTVVTKPDSIKNIIRHPVDKNMINQPEITPAPSVLKNRSNELMKVLTVNNPDVTVKLYDNGEIDGDTISVYLDNKIVLASKGLTASPLIFKFNMEDDHAEHELTLVAENLGTIPPNTALMIVEAGDQRFTVQITSTEQKNAVVRFKYRKLN